MAARLRFNDGKLGGIYPIFGPFKSNSHTVLLEQIGCGLRGRGRLGAPTGLIDAAHRTGLLVGTWTFRPENHFIAADFKDGRADGLRNEADSLAEMRHYLAAGIDGFFTDDPHLGPMAVDGDCVRV
jgi:glycerophosphoryl diester phosphodiesterase